MTNKMRYLNSLIVLELLNKQLISNGNWRYFYVWMKVVSHLIQFIFKLQPSVLCIDGLVTITNKVVGVTEKEYLFNIHIDEIHPNIGFVCCI